MRQNALLLHAAPHDWLKARAISRRRWIGSAMAAAGAACVAGAQQPLARGDDRQDAPADAIDAHVHVWTPDIEHYPLAAGFRRQDMAPPSFTPEQLLDLARPCGVARVVLIQMSFYGFDNSYLLDTIRRFPGVFSGVAVIDDARRPADEMRRLAKLGVRGLRVRPAGEAVDRWFSRQGIEAMWRTGAAESLAMCHLIDPEDLPALDRMCGKFAETPVVVDHFGRVGIDGTLRPADVENLCRLARHRQTYVKVSAFYALGKKQAPYLDLAPMIRRLLDSFGPERLMWATDCPFQVQNGHTYSDSIALVRERLDFLSAADREWLLRKTAARLFFG
jgi:predicted TIM-barrel fold metal-dependent hydrolase